MRTANVPVCKEMYMILHGPPKHRISNKHSTTQKHANCTIGYFLLPISVKQLQSITGFDMVYNLNSKQGQTIHSLFIIFGRP